MSEPIALAPFYDALMYHDWYYERSDDHSVWQRGLAEESRLQLLAKTSPEHQALYKAVATYSFGPRDAIKPARPAENAPFTLPPPRPSAAMLASLSDEDRAFVLAAPDPGARLTQVNRRLAIDAKVSIVDVLHEFGATPSENPARWTLPDGTRAMIKVDRQAWVEQNATLSTGKGATALARRVLGQPEDIVLSTLESRWGVGVAPVAASPEPPSVTEPTPRRFRSRP